MFRANPLRKCLSLDISAPRATKSAMRHALPPNVDVYDNSVALQGDRFVVYLGLKPLEAPSCLEQVSYIPEIEKRQTRRGRAASHASGRSRQRSGFGEYPRRSSAKSWGATGVLK